MERKGIRSIAVLLCMVMLFQTVVGDLGITTFASQIHETEEINVNRPDTENVDISANNTEPMVEGEKQNSDNDEENLESDKSVEDRAITLVCSDFSSTVVKLNWNMLEFTNVCSFSLYRDGVCINDAIKATDNADYSYSDTNIENNSSYRYKVCAYDADKNILGTSEEILVEVADDWVITANTTLTENKTVKNLRISKSTLNLGEYKLRVLGNVSIDNGCMQPDKGYLECQDLSVSNYGHISMTDPNGYICVNGDMYYEAFEETSMSEGKLELKGNFTYNTWRSKSKFLCSGNHITILSGEQKQTISFNANDNVSHFNIVDVTNKSKDGVVCNGPINYFDFHINGCNVDFGYEGGQSGWTLEEKQTIVACGAGTVSKRVFSDGRIERVDNVKDVALYIEKIDEMIERKRELFSDQM